MKKQMLLLGWILAVQITALALFGGQYQGIDLRNEFFSKSASATAADTITVGWIRHYGSGVAPALDEALAIAVDSSGNVYVTGHSYSSSTDYDYATIKYSADGTEAWVARYNGPGDSVDYAVALAVDGWGNVYVTGYSYGSSTHNDYATVKYTAAGAEVWVARYNGPANNDDNARAIALDDSGNVYVTGESEGSGGGLDYATIKYTVDGAEAWIARYNGPGNADDCATALALDDSGNVYVTGYSYSSDTNDDYATIKYAVDGTEVWIKRYNAPGNYSDRAQALAIDGAGTIYVMGDAYFSPSWPDYSYRTVYATVKYMAAKYSVLPYRGPGNGDDHARAIALDGSGNVYVTGYSYGLDTNEDYATIKYTALGGLQAWVARYNRWSMSNDYAEALAIDGWGNVYVTGASRKHYDEYMDYVTIKYTAAGAEAWVAIYDGPGNTDDHATALALDGSGNVYVTGWSGGGNWSIYTTIKYEQLPLSVAEKNRPLPQSYVLEQNYPNPFNQTTTISFSLASKSLVRLSVFDLLGIEVATLLSEELPAGKYAQHWNADDLPSGVYFYRFQAGSFVDTKKLILLK